MGREYALRASFLFAVAGVLASTSLAQAVDQHPDARQSAEQQVASQVNEMAKQVTQMQAQIAQINEELTALRNQQIEAQEALRATRELGNTSAGSAAKLTPLNRHRSPRTHSSWVAESMLSVGAVGPCRNETAGSVPLVGGGAKSSLPWRGPTPFPYQ